MAVYGVSERVMGALERQLPATELEDMLEEFEEGPDTLKELPTRWHDRAEANDEPGSLFDPRH